MSNYDEILLLRKELKRPGIFQRNHIQLRMLVWDMTIVGSLFFKRFMDFILSLLALIVLSPILLILIILGAIILGGNPFFTQLRPGKDEKIFRLLKLRSMTNKKDENGKHCFVIKARPNDFYKNQINELIQ